MPVISGIFPKVIQFQQVKDTAGQGICDMMSLLPKVPGEFRGNDLLTLQGLRGNYWAISKINRRPGNIDLMSQNQMLSVREGSCEKY